MSGHVRTLVSVVAKCNPAWTSIHFNLLSVWFWSDPDAIARCAHAPQVLPSAPLKLQQSETALRFLFLLRLPGFFIWNTTTTCQKSAVADIHGRYYSQPCLCQRRPRAGPAHPGRCCAAQPPARQNEDATPARPAHCVDGRGLLLTQAKFLSWQQLSLSFRRSRHMQSHHLLLMMNRKETICIRNTSLYNWSLHHQANTSKNDKKKIHNCNISIFHLFIYSLSLAAWTSIKYFHNTENIRPWIPFASSLIWR